MPGSTPLFLQSSPCIYIGRAADAIRLSIKFLESACVHARLLFFVSQAVFVREVMNRLFAPVLNARIMHFRGSRGGFERVPFAAKGVKLATTTHAPARWSPACFCAAEQKNENHSHLLSKIASALCYYTYYC